MDYRIKKKYTRLIKPWVCKYFERLNSKKSSKLKASDQAEKTVKRSNYFYGHFMPYITLAATYNYNSIALKIDVLLHDSTAFNGATEPLISAGNDFTMMCNREANGRSEKTQSERAYHYGRDSLSFQSVRGSTEGVFYRVERRKFHE